MGFFGAFLMRRGAIGPEDMVEALDAARRQRPRIGQLAIMRRLLSVSEVCDVLDRQVETRLPFGVIAVDLGYLTAPQLEALLRIQGREGAVGEDLLRRRGLIDDRNLSELRAAYTQELACEYASGSDDGGATELLAARGLSAQLAHAQCLRPIPPALRAALAELARPDADIAQVLGRLQSDRATEQRLVRLAGSVWFASERFDSLSELARTFDQLHMRDLLLVDAFMHLFDRSSAASLRLMEHSAATAKLALELAPLSGVSCDASLLLGAMLHDVGKFLLLEANAHDYHAMGADESEFPTSAHLIERLRLGYDHAALGEMALRLWGFPEEVAELVGMHHYHRPPSQLSLTGRATLGLITLSDRVEHALALSVHPEVDSLVAMSERFGLSGLTRDVLTARWPALTRARTQALAYFR